jgi:curved DNA-binding protein CbpA
MRVPRPKSGCDVKSLPLSPAEAFLLSRIDAATNERDLAMTTGLSPAVVAAALDRLAQLGAIEGAVPAAPVSAPVSVPPRVAVSVKPPRVEPPARSEPPTSARVAVEPAPRSAPVLYDAAELDEVVEIDDDKKRRILDLFYRLDDLTYYEVLAVETQADKKKIKSAYYAIAPEFHPDRFFRKNLGAFKPKIEAIFNRVTIAHDILTAKDRRAEYDAYLAQTQKNRVMAAIIEQTPRDVARAPVEVAIAEPASIAGAPGRYASEPAPARAPSLAPPSRPASDRPAASVRPSVEPGPISAEAARIRRETLARKLSGTMRRPTPPPPPVAPDPAAPQRTADALRVRHDLAVADARRAQLQRHLDEGKAALVEQQFAAAASAYRIAASLAPDDVEVQARFVEVMRLADASLADGYLKQAQYEESQGRWGEAALSYSKVCNGLPGNAAAHDRVAFATLKSSANIRRAVEFARRAVELEPKTPQFRLTLASAYQAAGLEKSALGEIERALELAPGDQKIKDLAQQVRVQAQKPAN